MQDFHPLHERSKRQPSGERNFLSKTNQFSSSIELVCAFHKLIKERVYLCNELLLSSILKMSSITYYDFVQVNVRRLDCCCSELVYLYMKDGRHSPWDLFQPKCWEVLLCSLKRSMVVGIGKWCDGGSTASFYELGELSVHWTSYLVRSFGSPYPSSGCQWNFHLALCKFQWNFLYGGTFVVIFLLFRDGKMTKRRLATLTRPEMNKY